jgi:cation diffusion facilitator family transporter
MTSHGHSNRSHDHGGRDHDHDAHDHGHEHRRGLRGAVQAIFAPHSHDAADSIDSALESSQRGIRAVKISFVALMVTAVFQLVVIVASGSIALLADTIHNFSDALTAVPLFIAFRLAQRKPTRRYTYGYGRAEDLAGLFVITMIAISAVIAAYEAVRRLIDPQPIDHLGWVVAAGVIGFLGNELVAMYRIREGRAIGSAALAADGYHARTDGFTSLAVVLGALGVWAGFDAADPIAGLAISIAIFAVLRRAAVDVLRRLMNGVDPELVQELEDEAAQVPGVKSVRSVQVRWEGHRLQADLAIGVAPNLDVIAGHAVAHAVEHELLHHIPHLDAAAIHVEPDGPERERAHAPAAHHH